LESIFLKQNIWVLVILRKVFYLTFELGLLVFAFYLIGNWQNTLDTSQLLLLSMIQWLSLISFFIGFFLVILTLLLGDDKSRRLSPSLWPVLLVILVNIALILASQLIETIEVF